MATRAVIGIHASEPGLYLVSLDTADGRHALVVQVQHGTLRGPAIPLQSLLAHISNWNEWTGTAEESAAILAVVPDNPEIGFTVPKPVTDPPTR